MVNPMRVQAPALPLDGCASKKLRAEFLPTDTKSAITGSSAASLFDDDDPALSLINPLQTVTSRQQQSHANCSAEQAPSGSCTAKSPPLLDRKADIDSNIKEGTHPDLSLEIDDLDDLEV